MKRIAGVDIDDEKTYLHVVLQLRHIHYHHSYVQSILPAMKGIALSVALPSRLPIEPARNVS